MKKSRASRTDDVTNIGQEVARFARRVPLWVWWVLVLIFGAFIFQAVFIAFSTIEYKGMTFTKEKMGELIFYHHSYYIDAQTKYNLYLRTDPRKNTVPLEGVIEFPTDTVYVSVNTTGLVSCEDSQIGVGQLSLFLVQNKLQLIPASPDPALAQAYNMSYASCSSSHLNGTIIVLETGTESGIHISENDCYTLVVADCAVMPVVDKFIVESLVTARTQKQ